MQSPELTHIYPPCPKCGNAERYTGHDFHGYGYDEDGEPAPAVDTHLTQDFTVIEPGSDPDYHTHDGIEIGPYQRIDCGDCGAILFQQS